MRSMYVQVFKTRNEHDNYTIETETIWLSIIARNDDSYS